ncbi:hypothetical protein HMPREF3226_01015 [Prevotella corporis]|uniref:Uncharacterized protein n=1 Tax=Prevotella corporis TaxID=28128 RepID=A0A133QCZ0_9BACT|nr:hypothetical protein HMPREF3226_01015 [Prevotella corporis]
MNDESRILNSISHIHNSCNDCKDNTKNLKYKHYTAFYLLFRQLFNNHPTINALASMVGRLI